MSDAFLSSLGPLEEAVTACWRMVLGRPVVGVNDNFYELGGSSVHAIQLHRQLQERLGVSCSVLAIFQYPTVRSFVEALQKGLVWKADTSAQSVSSPVNPAPVPVMTKNENAPPLERSSVE